MVGYHRAVLARDLGMKRALDTFLMLDVLFIAAMFVWFVAINIGRAVGVELGLPLFQALWMPVIQPALGIFFLGVLVSFVQSKWPKRS